MKNICVTGAGGQTGRCVVKCLSQQKGNFEIRACLQPSQRVHQEAQLRPYKVQIVDIEPNDKTSLCNAFKGIETLIVIPCSETDKVKSGKNCLQAAKDCGVKCVILLSIVCADDADCPFANQFGELEQFCKELCFENCICVRSGYYMQNLLCYNEQLQKNCLPLPIKSCKFPPVDVEDVGAIVAKISENCDQHKNKCYNLTGPECLSGQEMASTISKLANRQVEFRDITPEETKQILKKKKIPDYEIQGTLEFCNLVAKNKMDWVSHDFQQVVGHKGTTFFDFMKKHEKCIWSDVEK